MPELAAEAHQCAGPALGRRDAAGRTLLVTRSRVWATRCSSSALAQPLAARGARVVVSAAAPLVRLLASAPGVARSSAPATRLPPYDAHLPLLSLPARLGVTPRVDPGDRALSRRGCRRGARKSRGCWPRTRAQRKVGIAWAGSRANANDRSRSIPLAALAPLFELPGIAWFSLQQERRRGGDRDGAAAARARSGSRCASDFDGMAALVAELDLVISVDTSIAHLAGALARPTWMLLASAADWRWQPRGADSPWYPTVRLFRQPRPGDWTAVVLRVRDELAGAS